MSTTEPDTPDTEPDGDEDGGDEDSPNTVVVVGDNATVNLTDADDGEPDADDSGTTP